MLEQDAVVLLERLSGGPKKEIKKKPRKSNTFFDDANEEDLANKRVDNMFREDRFMANLDDITMRDESQFLNMNDLGPDFDKNMTGEAIDFDNPEHLEMLQELYNTTNVPNQPSMNTRPGEGLEQHMEQEPATDTPPSDVPSLVDVASPEPVVPDVPIVDQADKENVPPENVASPVVSELHIKPFL